MNAADFWWKHITGPESFVNAVTRSLQEKHIPLLQLPFDLPWRHNMRNAVWECYQDSFPEYDPLITIIDASDECGEGEDIGEYLLHHFASEYVSSCYRERSGKTIQQYLVENDVLRNHILWIKGIEEKDTSRWMAFCQGFPRVSPESGMFVLEIRSYVPSMPNSIFEDIVFKKLINHHDVQLFNSFLMSRQKDMESVAWQNYMAVAAACLCDFDAELSEALLNGGDWSREDPCAMLVKLGQDERFTRRGHNVRDTHILSFIRQNKRGEVIRRLWSAQLQILFPLLEMQRLRIIDTFQEALTRIIREQHWMQFNQVVENPEELELGALACLLTKRAGYEYNLPIIDGKLQENIQQMRNCRNLLAHRHQCCTPEQVDFILTNDERLNAILERKNGCFY